MNFPVVIVTGAASGMGAAIAISFAKLEAQIFITDINGEGLSKTRMECQKLSRNKIVELVGDVRNNEDQNRIVELALKEFRKIDVLVNCAGIFQRTNLRDSDIIEKFDRIVAVNLRSIVGLTNKALPALIESKGCVINISSVSSTLITEDGLIYCMTKAGVTTFTKCAASELAPLGVRVNSIAPGPVKTNIYLNTGASEEENEKFWSDLAASVPMKKCVKAEEIGELAVYLASDKAASITGSQFVVDAGITLGTNAKISDVKNNHN